MSSSALAKEIAETLFELDWLDVSRATLYGEIVPLIDQELSSVELAIRPFAKSYGGLPSFNTEQIRRAHQAHESLKVE